MNDAVAVSVAVVGRHSALTLDVLARPMINERTDGVFIRLSISHYDYC